MDTFFCIAQGIKGLLWGWPVLAAILLAGANLSVRSGFFPITRCRLWLKKTLFRLFRPSARREGREGVSAIQALSTALAGSIGTGNIVGVATALTLGGPGAIFWMWISAILGMMTIFAENVLGMKYRVRDETGEWHGGAMYYIERGLHSKLLAKVFAFACVLASLGMGNMAQANSISQAFRESFHVPAWVTGPVLAVVVFVIACGGIRRTARVAEKVVPVMALGYLLACITVLIVCRARVGAALSEIISEAFSLQSAAGGVGGTVMMRAMQTGVSRGIFTNEAGLGSSVMAHTSTCGTSPVEQGMWGIFQVFVDTIVMCTLTALCILSSGAMSTGKDGAALSAETFRRVFGDAGASFVAVAVAMFAFATMLAWCCYGEAGLRYLIGKKGAIFYRAIFALAALLACHMALGPVWDLCDTFNGLMAVPNLAAVFFLSGEVIEELRRYCFSERRESLAGKARRKRPERKKRKIARRDGRPPATELGKEKGSIGKGTSFSQRSSG